MKDNSLPSRRRPGSSKEIEKPSLELQEARARIDELEERLALAEAEQEVLQESEARFRILSELIADCCWARWGDAAGATHRVWVNDAFESLTGYSPEEFETIGREGLVHPEDLEATLQYIDGPLGIQEHEFRILRKDGQVRWLREKMLVEQTGEVLQVLGATQDITARKDAEEILRQGNRLLEQRVSTRTRELEASNQRLKEEIQTRQQTEESLRQARDAAQQASQAKSRFLANISHEIRTPLSGVLGLAELLLKEGLHSRAARQLGMLRTSTESLRHLVESVLDFSRIEADRLHLTVSDFSVADIEFALRSVLGQRAEEKGLQILVHRDEDVPDFLRGDAERLRQILLNLLDNAIKFTEEGAVQLEALGIDCTVAAGGGEALAALEEGIFDLVLMDCQMPGIDGYQATETLRSREHRKHRTPIIALTASAVREDLDLCYEAGMDDILAKPYRESQLRAVLTKWLPPRSLGTIPSGSEE